jgi:hypothetical protein
MKLVKIIAVLLLKRERISHLSNSLERFACSINVFSAWQQKHIIISKCL